MFQEVHKHWKS